MEKKHTPHTETLIPVLINIMFLKEESTSLWVQQAEGALDLRAEVGGYSFMHCLRDYGNSLFTVSHRNCRILQTDANILSSLLLYLFIISPSSKLEEDSLLSANACVVAMDTRPTQARCTLWRHVAYSAWTRGIYSSA